MSKHVYIELVVDQLGDDPDLTMMRSRHSLEECLSDLGCFVLSHSCIIEDDEGE